MRIAAEMSAVSFRYDEGSDVLGKVDLAIEEEAFIAVAGPNGGGKTTLIRILLGLLRPTAGEAHLHVPAAYLPQRAASGMDAPVTVAEVVASGRVGPGRALGRMTEDDRRSVAWAIDRVGLAGLERRPLRRLSGGQQQRAFIAKAISARPQLLVLDEPTAGVDVESQHALAALLDELRRDLAMAVVFVSHEFGAIEPFVQRLVLVAGGISFDGPPAQLSTMWHDPSHVHP